MLTSLPDETYTHEDVVKLVWNYFPKQNLHSLYYRVMVLPLQRRVRSRLTLFTARIIQWRFYHLLTCFSLLTQAFVYFSKWETCCKFAQNHLRNPVSVKGSVLNIHLVLENMDPGTSEV